MAWFRDRSQNPTEGESPELKATNEKLKPFKVGQEVNIIPHGRNDINLDDGWTISGYSDQFQEALLYKENVAGEIQSESEDIGGKPPKYLHEKASIKLLLVWNPEFIAEE